MDFDDRTREIAATLHKSNSKVMLPVTVSSILGMLAYLTLVLQGLKPADGVYHFQVFAKLILCILVFGGANVVFFELWVRRELLKGARSLAWDGSFESLSREEALSSYLSLLDFPHRFIIRFLLQWLLVAPLIIVSVRLFYAIPVLSLVFLAIGVVAIMALMSTFHYFKIKAVYLDELREGLKKFPHYFEQRELGRRRIRYRTKILIYIVVLVGAVTWIATHLHMTSQHRSEAVQRDRFIRQSMDIPSVKLLADDLKFNQANPDRIRLWLPDDLGRGRERVYVLSYQGLLLFEQTPEEGLEPEEIRRAREVDQKIRDLLVMPYHPPSSLFDRASWSEALSRPFRAGFWRSFFRLGQPILIRITDHVLMAYVDGGQFTVTVYPIGEPARGWLLTIHPHEVFSAELAIQMGPLSFMLLLALVLSLLFAHYMQKELMDPLTLLIKSSRRAEAGDLSEPDPIIADDEIGELAVHHLRMMAGLRAMVRQIAQAGEALDAAALQIAERTEQTAQGSEEQSVAVEETSASITQMNQTIGNIAESVDTLASSAEQSSASILQMSATNDQVANNAEALSEAVEQTTANLQQTSASVKQVAENVQDAAGKSSEAATAMREMREVVKSVDQIAAESARLSEQVTQNAETGARSVQSTLQGIVRIKDHSREAGEVIERLSERARDIGRILTVIEDVTEETNLLALNAAIIAAQAGEHGRGFAVVADEIKQLAERTSGSTREIHQLIRGVQEESRQAVGAVEEGARAVEEGVKLTDQASSSLAKIRESTRLATERVHGVAKTTVEQAESSRMVSQAIDRVADMVGQISAATQQQSRGGNLILKATEEMKAASLQVKRNAEEQLQGSKLITKSIENITDMLYSINQSQQEQKRSSHQVVQLMDRIKVVSQESVESARRLAEVVDALTAEADTLREEMRRFMWVGANGPPKADS